MEINSKVYYGRFASGKTTKIISDLKKLIHQSLGIMKVLVVESCPEIQEDVEDECEVYTLRTVNKNVKLDLIIISDLRYYKKIITKPYAFDCPIWVELAEAGPRLYEFERIGIIKSANTPENSVDGFCTLFKAVCTDHNSEIDKIHSSLSRINNQDMKTFWKNYSNISDGLSIVSDDINHMYENINNSRINTLVELTNKVKDLCDTLLQCKVPDMDRIIVQIPVEVADFNGNGDDIQSNRLYIVFSYINDKARYFADLSIGRILDPFMTSPGIVFDLSFDKCVQMKKLGVTNDDSDNLKVYYSHEIEDMDSSGLVVIDNIAGHIDEIIEVLEGEIKKKSDGRHISKNR